MGTAMGTPTLPLPLFSRLLLRLLGWLPPLLPLLLEGHKRPHVRTRGTETSQHFPRLEAKTGYKDEASHGPPSGSRWVRRRRKRLSWKSPSRTTS